MAFIAPMQRTGLLIAVGLGFALNAAVAQKPVTISEPPTPLLPQRFGVWREVTAAKPASDNALANISKEALAECGLQRTETSEYAHDGRTVRVEAMEFNDRTGATSAFTLAEAPGMKPGTTVGASDAFGGPSRSAGDVLFLQGTSVVLADFGTPVTSSDIESLKPLAAALPKIGGNRGIAPLLPTLIPRDGLVQGSVKYALGPVSYAAEGGVLASDHLGWDHELEAATAQYDDSRGKETLTLLMYPTPTIAENYAKSIDAAIKQAAPGAPTSMLHREGLLVMVASGTFSPSAAARMMSDIHLKQMTFNQDVQPAFPVVAKQTFSLLTNIAILSGVLMAGAVLLGLFLGVGRATFRVMRGKPAAIEPEFLSLHLSPQSKPAQFQSSEGNEQDSGAR
jgi:hypothetical protein